MFMILGLSASLSLSTACDDSSDGGTQGATEETGDGDGDGDQTGDGDGDQTGDGDGDQTGDGDGDQTGDGDGDPCLGLADEDAIIPGDCQCVGPGEPCAQGCFDPDGMTTCAQVCAQVGQTCVANGCGDGFTYLEGTPGECPVPAEYGAAEPLGCDEPVPVIDWVTPDFETIGAACCCTQS
jgi:hypothetical protein